MSANRGLLCRDADRLEFLKQQSGMGAELQGILSGVANRENDPNGEAIPEVVVGVEGCQERVRF